MSLPLLEFGCLQFSVPQTETLACWLGHPTGSTAVSNAAYGEATEHRFPRRVQDWGYFSQLCSQTLEKGVEIYHH